MNEDQPPKVLDGYLVEPDDDRPPAPPTKPYAKLSGRMTDGERRAWLAGLRTGKLSASAQSDLAAILERQWFPDPNGGRPSKAEMTAWQRANRDLRAWLLSQDIVQAAGENGRRDVAEGEVASEQGVERRGLQRQMKGRPSRSRKAP